VPLPIRSALSSLAAGLALLLALPSPAARAQAGHPLVNPIRTLHERLASADRVVRGRIAAVATGRISVEDARALVGTSPPAFEIKRSPLNPPPLAVGDEAILFLAGARPPFVLLDRPVEVIRLVEPGQAARWTAAIRALAAARGDAAAEIAIYLGWIDEGPATLRALAGGGIGELLRTHPALRAGVAADRVAHAVDPAADPGARDFSAQLAASTPTGAARLCRALLEGDAPLLARTTELALRGGALAAAPDAAALLRRAVRDRDARVRLAAARALPTVASADREAALAAARHLAEHDTDASIRRRGERIVRELAELRPPRPTGTEPMAPHGSTGAGPAPRGIPRPAAQTDRRGPGREPMR